jgi:hypothetical protein
MIDQQPRTLGWASAMYLELGSKLGPTESGH